ncbi:MAG: UDP-3-O-(3-hydroxymyristoyl)glucosamine N-acyltransferase [bacterium]|nr:UDP-3-O-(3-hydroxymyristoyl)glucosamine N-acyltransferase [bacterium]MDE0416805.1 UDP-3-O-(3-hydroxymyristoyl)glucosamine N-acyltransferase [bacterium]
MADSHVADTRFFRRKGPFALAAILEATGARVAGRHDASRLFHDVAGLADAGSADLTFLDNVKYVAAFTGTRAGGCFVREQHSDRAPKGVIALISDNPYLAFARAARMFYPDPAVEPGVSAKAFIESGASIGEGARIDAFAVIRSGAEIGARCSVGAGCVVEHNVRIGDDCQIGPGAVLMFCVIGNRVRIESGARVGTEGFGFAASPDGAVRLPHVGRVVIGDDVGIGANTTIDRGSLGDTVIGDGAMIDNQVQIAHNAKVGRHAILAGQVGLAGSAVVGDFAMLGGQSGVANHVKVGSGARIGGNSSAASDLEGGGTYLGAPAIPQREFWRLQVMLRRLARHKNKTP